jgi:hypothetical protein
MTRARDVADNQENLGGGVPPFTAGKNAIINGDFGVWQRGTSFTNPATTAYTADRWRVQQNGTGATRVISQQTFTPGTAPVAGYEGKFFARYAVSVAGTGNTFQNFEYNQEDIRTFAGQTVTWSFWAKADASRTVDLLYRTDFGTGGSSPNQYSVGSVTLTTSWARYSVTYAVPSVSGLTIGTNSYGSWIFRPPAATVQTIDIWGVQIEAGNVATPFTTATGTIQGELAACQRYYVRRTGTYGSFGQGQPGSTTLGYITMHFPVPLRVAPTAVDVTGTVLVIWGSGSYNTISAYSFANMDILGGSLVVTTSGLTVNQPLYLAPSNAGSIGFSAEL